MCSEVLFVRWEKRTRLLSLLFFTLWEGEEGEDRVEGGEKKTNQQRSS